MVIGAAKTPPPPGVSQLYTTVHFDECGQEHQLTTEEMEPVEVDAGAASPDPEA